MIKRGKLLYLITLIIFGSVVIYALSFSDLTQSDFNNGTYTNTTHNGSAVILSGNNLAGTYTSRIFDATALARWNNISWFTETCYSCALPNNQGMEDGNYFKKINMSGNVLLLHMDETSGSIIDYSGNGNNGITNGGVTYGISGRFNKTLGFDGNNDYVNISHSNSINLNDSYSMEIWVSPDIDATEWRRFLEKGQNNQYYLSYIGGSKIRVQINGYSNIDSNSIISKGNWTHVVVTVLNTPSGNDFIKLYINGKLDNSLGPVWGTPGTSTGQLVIGASGGLSEFFKGRVDEVALYNRTLSDAEILDRYKRGILKLNLSVRGCDDVICSGKSWADVFDNSPQDLGISNNRYFQYKFIFETENTSYSPYLYNVSVDYNSLGPVILVIYPENSSYNFVQTILNYTILGSDLQTCWYSLNEGSTNISITCRENITGLNSGQGSSKWRIYANDSFGNLNYSEVTFFVDSIYPLINYTSATEANGSKVSRNWIYVVVDVVEDNERNITFSLYNSSSLINKTVFTNFKRNINWTNLSDGTYFYDVSVVDFLNNRNITEMRTLIIDTKTPIIKILSPIEKELFLQNISLPLNFTITNSTPLGICWYAIDDIENITIPTCENTNFIASEGVHNLKLYANSSSGNLAIDSVNFSVSVTPIVLNISQPIETKTSKSGIPIQFTASGINLTCWYNVAFSTGAISISNTSLTNCSSSTFSVSVDGDYIFNLYANNSFGVLNSTSSSFSVLTTTVSGGGGGGGGGSTTIITGNLTTGLELGSIDSLIVNPGETKKISLSAKNSGTSFLNNCKANGKGGNSNWISAGGVKNLAAGEAYDFNFNLNIPLGTNAGKHSLSIEVACDEISKSVEFNVEILEKKLGLKIIEVKRESSDKVRVSYSLEELSGKDQDVQLQFLLFDSDNKRVAEISETKSIPANSKQDFETIIPLDPNLKGDFNLLINLNSEAYSTFVQEGVVLSAPVTGFVLFGNKVSTDNLVSGVLIVLFLVFVFFIIKRIIRLRRSGRGAGKKRKIVGKKGVMFIDNRFIEIIKKECSGKNLKRKWVDVKFKKR